MATRLYHYDKGIDPNATSPRLITQEAGQATTNGVELTVDLAKITNRNDVLLALEYLEVYITSNVWPPA